MQCLTRVAACVVVVLGMMTPVTASSSPTSQPAASAPTTSPAESPGSVSGKLLHRDGTAAAGIRLRLVAEWHSGFLHPSAKAKRTPPSPREGYRVITEDDGTFSFKDVPPDGYVLMGGNKQIGWVLQWLVVEPGGDHHVEAQLHLPE